MDQIKLIVFDKDGTLMELGSVIVKLADDLINEFSSRSNIHVPKSEIKNAFGIVDDRLDMMLKSNHARRFAENLRMLPNGDALAQWTLEKMEHLSSDNEVDAIEIIKGIPETLKQLKAAGYQLAIVSADDTLSMDLFLNKYHIKDYFDLVVTSDSTPYQKPQKQLMDYILKTLDRTPDETMMVGDTVMDVMLGNNSNVKKVIGVLSGSGDKQDLQHADEILDNVNELIEKRILPI